MNRLTSQSKLEPQKTKATKNKQLIKSELKDTKTHVHIDISTHRHIGI